MELTGQDTHYDEKGNQKDNFSFEANGVRIPLTVLPNSIDTLPTPPEP